MGYILPNTPLQYSDYANRIAYEAKQFTYIDSAQAIEAQNRFYDEVRRTQKRYEQVQQVKRKRKHDFHHHTPTEEVLRYQPKPMSTAEILGKGFVINAYA